MANPIPLPVSDERVARLDQKLLTSLRDHVHHALRSAILSGRFAADERLNERHLAEQLGVSTTPIKEALRQLEAEGLVETLARRGVIIRFNANWAEETILARAALEAMIARLAAKRINQDAIHALEHTIVRMRTASSNAAADDLIELNETFHDQIHVASECRYLAKMIERQRFYDASIRRIIHMDPSERANALEEHSDIAAAIISGDSDHAEKAMRDHVMRSGNSYLSRIFSKREEMR
jgi:DNA-binding GntR family transcriptional regulator